VSNKRVPNFKRQLCPSGLCELANPFISGVLKCSEEYELYSKTDVYFTGLNNEFGEYSDIKIKIKLKLIIATFGKFSSARTFFFNF